LIAPISMLSVMGPAPSVAGPDRSQTRWAIRKSEKEYWRNFTWDGMPWKFSLLIVLIKARPVPSCPDKFGLCIHNSKFRSTFDRGARKVGLDIYH